MIDNVLLDRIEVIDLGSWAGPGDDSLFVATHAAGYIGWYGPVAEACGQHIDTLAHAITGERVADHRGLHRVLRTAVGKPTDKAVSWAVGAVDCAVWDLHGHLASVPVANLLTLSPVPAVPAYASWLRLDLTDPSSSEVVARTARQPWRLTKWGMRLEPSRTDISGLVGAVRRTADHAGGPIALDALGTWTWELAEAFAERTDPSALVWLEDPLPVHDLHGYRRIAATGLPLAVGEGLLVDDDAAELVRTVRPAAFTLDVVGCGGLTRAVEIIDLARTIAVPVYPHGRSLVPAVQLAAAFPDTVAAVEYRLQWEPARQLLYTEPLLPRLGQLRIPTRPGLGITPRSR